MQKEFISENARAVSRIVPKGSLLVTCIGIIGKIGIVDIDECAFNQQINAIVPNYNIKSKYLAYVLFYNRGRLNDIANAPVVPIINKSEFENFEVNIIDDIKKQENIIQILDKIENIIYKYECILKALDTFIKARFVEMFGDIESNDKNFKIVKFEDCIEYIGDIGSNGANKVVVDRLDMKDEEDYALLIRFLNFTNNDFKNNVKYISEEAYNFFKKSQIFGGELIFCKIGSAGLNYIMPYLNRPVSLGLNQIMIRTKGNINILYLHNYLNLPYGKKLVENCINGAVTKSITKTEIKKIPILLPPIELQNQFATFVKEVDKLKFDAQKSLEKTQMLFNSLIQQYFV